MIEKLEDYQFPLHGEAAASYLDLVIQQRTGRKPKATRSLTQISH